MAASRVFLLSLFLLVVSSIVNAATMSPTFEKSLGERLAKRQATIEAYPKLKFSTYLPETVDIWRVLTESTLSYTISVFKDSIEIQFPSLLKRYPGDAAVINQFSQECKDFVTFYEAGVKSGDIAWPVTSPPTWTPSTWTPRTWTPVTMAPRATPAPPVTFAPSTMRPTTAPPPPATKTPKPSRGSRSDDGDALDLDIPYTYKPYSYSPSPTYPSFNYYPSYSTPSPQYVSNGYHTTKTFSWWKICLIVLPIVIFLARVLYWANQRHTKQKMKAEEEAAAAAAFQAEGGELSHATYVVIRPTETETAAVPMKA